MKKLLVFVAGLALVVSANAMALDWQYNAAAADVGKTVYVMLGATAQTSWESIDAVEQAAIDSGAITKKSRVYNASGSFTSDDINKTTANVYYVIVSADKTSFDVTSVANMASSVYDPANQESSSGSNTSLSNSSIASSGNSFSGGGGGGGEPEPTSGLLMLVGLGVLGLRRKMK